MLSVQMYVCIDVWMYRCMDVGFSSTSKGKTTLSNENVMTDFHKTWYVGSGGAQVLRTWSVITECAYLTPHLHICSNNKKVKYPEFCMDYIDETCYVSSDGHKYYPRSLFSSNVHI